MFRCRCFAPLLFSCCFLLQAQPPAQPDFISVREPVVALTHVRLIDGTGEPERQEQAIIIDHGVVARVGDAASIPIPPGARVLSLAGHTVYPGLIGMHEHLFYPSGNGAPVYDEQVLSAPRLYLAAGITTMRTAGSLEPYTDLNIKRMIDRKIMSGPTMDVTGPYIEGPNSFAVQMPVVSTPAQARRLVDYWVAEGVTSFKAYMQISHDSLQAAIEQAHSHNVKVTGHLCSVGFSEAAELGIDNLEHGLIVDTEFTPGKKKDTCPSQRETISTIASLDVHGPAVSKIIQILVTRHVAITSTLAVFERFLPDRLPLPQSSRDAMSADAKLNF